MACRKESVNNWEIIVGDETSVGSADRDGSIPEEDAIDWVGHDGRKDRHQRDRSSKSFPEL
jgi:hypothetical protein